MGSFPGVPAIPLGCGKLQLLKQGDEVLAPKDTLPKDLGSDCGKDPPSTCQSDNLKGPRSRLTYLDDNLTVIRREI